MFCSNEREIIAEFENISKAYERRLVLLHCVIHFTIYLSFLLYQYNTNFALRASLNSNLFLLEIAPSLQ